MINVDYVNKRWIGKVVEGLTMEHFLLLLSVFVLASAQQPTPCGEYFAKIIDSILYVRYTLC